MKENNKKKYGRRNQKKFIKNIRKKNILKKLFKEKLYQ